jgi:hypothetical protein
MPQVERSGGHERRDIEPVYCPSGDGAIVVYAGDLLLAMGADEHVVPGTLELRLSPRPEFSAQVAGRGAWLLAPASDSQHPTVALPPGVALDPPTSLASTAPPEGTVPGADVSIPINRMTAGELRLAQRLLLHVSGPLSSYPLPSRETGSGQQAQPQLPWSLSGWDLRLAEAGGPEAVDDFSFVVEAIPHDLPLDLDATERLCSQVFLLLSLIAGQEIGVAPVVGIDAAGRVVWADWGAPRFRPEQSAWRWCPRHLVNQALPALATGLSWLADDPALQQVVDRAGRHLLAGSFAHDGLWRVKLLGSIGSSAWSGELGGVDVQQLQQSGLQRLGLGDDRRVVAAGGNQPQTGQGLEDESPGGLGWLADV